MLEPKLPWSRRAVDNEPNFVRGWLFLARTEIDMGRLDAARLSLDRATAAARLGPSAHTGYEKNLVRFADWQYHEIRRILEAR